MCWKYIALVLTLPDLKPHPQWPDPIGKQYNAGEQSTKRFRKLPRIWAGRIRPDGESFTIASYVLKDGLYEYCGDQPHIPSSDGYVDPFTHTEKGRSMEWLSISQESIMDMRDDP
jgi:hypothetical protein